MARSKEFDPDQALSRAVELFHRQGYEATSMQDLVDHMEIGRQSLYQTFGNKRALFRKALDRYTQENLLGLCKALETSETPLETIRGFFDQGVDRTARQATRLGCLLSNTCVELAPHDGEIASECIAVLTRVEKAFHTALKNAQARGDLSADKSARAIARFLVSTIQGLTVVAKAGAPRPFLRDSVNVAMKVLD